MKTHNPLADLKPLNAAVEVHMRKDIAMSEIATQFIGRTAAPSHTDSSTRNYEQAWGTMELSNTGRYTAQDIVMVSGSGPWRDITGEQIQTVFDTHYQPLLQAVVKAEAQVVVGNAKGTDQLVQRFLESQGYRFEARLGTKGYRHYSPQ